MMNYICIEEGEIIGIFNYQPEVPESVTVVEVSDEQNQQIVDGTHYFDVADLTVKPRPQQELDAESAAKQLEIDNAKKRSFLSSTDWKVMRHNRQKALGIATTLTEDEYISLENERQEAANGIINP